MKLRFLLDEKIEKPKVPISEPIHCLEEGGGLVNGCWRNWWGGGGGEDN